MPGKQRLLDRHIVLFGTISNVLRRPMDVAGVIILHTFTKAVDNEGLSPWPALGLLQSLGDTARRFALKTACVGW